MLRIILCFIIIGSFITTQAQVGIGTTAPAGALDIVSTTGGLIPPRMTSAQRDALTSSNRPTGAIIYNTTTQCLQMNTGTPATPTWTCFQVPTTTTGVETFKLTYAASAGDSTKILTVGDFKFRFSQGALSPSGTAPQMALVANPGSTLTYNFNATTNGSGYTTATLGFNTSNYSTFQKILGVSDYMSANELNEIYFPDTNNRYYRMTFNVQPLGATNIFTLIVEKF